MQITGMIYGRRLLELADFPIPVILESGATLSRVEDLIKKQGKCVVKPVFYGGANSAATRPIKECTTLHR